MGSENRDTAGGATTNLLTKGVGRGTKNRGAYSHLMSLVIALFIPLGRQNRVTVAPRVGPVGELNVTPHATQAPEVDIDRPELEDVTSYEDDGALVICDKQNPNAWIRSGNLTILEP